MKTKKVPARAKNKNPGRNGEKVIKPRTEKGSPGPKVKKDSDIMEHREMEAGLEKTRSELAVIKKTADEGSEFAESVTHNGKSKNC